MVKKSSNQSHQIKVIKTKSSNQSHQIKAIKVIKSKPSNQSHQIKENKDCGLWDMKTCRPVDGYQRFGENLFVFIQGISRP
jgi:hypothetical protein